ncbi:hypothetical protein FIU92_09930 [Ruegeria sp. THAF33]|nr:hypothetical protein FIU92_09930 [Ruegeria sp. THAF33]
MTLRLLMERFAARKTPVFKADKTSTKHVQRAAKKYGTAKTSRSEIAALFESELRGQHTNGSVRDESNDHRDTSPKQAG